MHSNTKINLTLKEPEYSGTRCNYSPATWNNYRFINRKTKKIAFFVIEIELRQIKCPYCQEFFFNEEDYLYILEHEMTEAICCKVYSMEYKEPPEWNAEGFNDIFENIHIKCKTHKCGLHHFHARYG